MKDEKLVLDLDLRGSDRSLNLLRARMDGLLERGVLPCVLFYLFPLRFLQIRAQTGEWQGKLRKLGVLGKFG